MLRNQLLRGMDLKLVNLDRYRKVQQGGESQMMSGITEVEPSYDMPAIANDLRESSGERLLYEGTWSWPRSSITGWDGT